MRSLVAWTVWWALAAVAGGCSSSISKRPGRPARPRPPSPGAAVPVAPVVAVAPHAPRPNVSFPTFQCEPQYSEFYCLNGGACFTVVISESPIYNCECRAGFVGQRCEYKDLDDSYVLTSRQLMMETAGIAGGAAVAVFLALLVCFGAWLRLRRKPAPEPGGGGRGVTLVRA